MDLQTLSVQVVRFPSISGPRPCHFIDAEVSIQNKTADSAEDQQNQSPYQKETGPDTGLFHRGISHAAHLLPVQ